MAETLKKLFQEKHELIAKTDEKEEEIEKLVKKELDNLYLEEEWTGFQDKRQSDEWQVYVENEDFILYYQFGQIDFKKLLRLREIFKKTLVSHREVGVRECRRTRGLARARCQAVSETLLRD